MTAGAVLRQKRHEARLTQSELAARLGVSESALRAYESGDKVLPHDVADLAARVLRSPEVVFAKCEECPANWLSVCIIDADLHPAAEILRVMEESEEALRAAQELGRKSGRLCRELVERTCDQVLDLVPLACAALSVWCRAYGLDLKAVQRRHLQKLVSRGYLRKEGAA